MASYLKSNIFNSTTSKVSVVDSTIVDNSGTNSHIKIPAGLTAEEGFPSSRAIRYDTEINAIRIFDENLSWSQAIDSFSIYSNTRPGSGIVRDGLVLYIDAGNPVSYPGAGLNWEDLNGTYTIRLTSQVAYDSQEGSGSLLFSGSINSRGDIEPEIITFDKATPWTLSWWYRPQMQEGRWYRENIIGSSSYSSPGFNLINEYFTPFGTGVAIDDVNEKIYLTGRFTKFNGVGAFRLVRLNYDGSIDTAFNNALGTGFTQGSSEYSYVSNVKVSADGQSIYVSGDFYTFNGQNAYRIAKLNYDGTLDTTFQQNNGFNSTVMTIELDETDPENPYLYCGGYFSRYRGAVANRLARLNAITGDLDTTFSAGGLTQDGGAGTGPVLAIAVSPDGQKVLFTGDNFNEYEGTPISECVCLLNRDGTLDSIFHGNLPVGIDRSRISRCCHIDSQGKIYIGGNHDYINNQTGLGIARFTRLNADGTFDTTFLSDVRNGEPWSIETVFIGGEEKIYLTGSFTNVYGSTNERIIRMNYDGTKDDQFDNAIGLANRTDYDSTAVDSSGNIYAAGYFSSYKGVSSNGFVKILADGSFDTSFNIGSAIEDGYYRLRWEFRWFWYTGSITAPAYWLGLGKVNNGTPRRFQELAQEYDKQWINITATMTEDFIFRFYINGNNTATSNWSNQYYGAENINNTMDAGLIITKIGVRGTGTNVGDPFTGHISNIQIYDRVLSNDEVKQNYDSFKSRFGL